MKEQIQYHLKVQLIKWFQGRMYDYEVEIYENESLIFTEEFATKKPAKKLYDQKVQELEFNLSQISFAL